MGCIAQLPIGLKFSIAAALLVGACGASGPEDAFQSGEKGRVVRIIDGDALVLNTGQSVRLIGIEAPAPERRNRPGEDYAKEASRTLEDMALGREVQLYYAGLTRDRYDRALAHVFTKDELGPTLWLNYEMLSRGGARLRIYPDTARGSYPLADAEREARQSKNGLWARASYEILRADELPDDAARFQIVQGVLENPSPSATAACERAFFNSWLHLEVTQAAADICLIPSGAKVEARGYIFKGRMEVVHALNVQIVER